MLQRRNTYLFYSRKNFYWLSSHEWNYQTKKILKISSITILLKLKKKLKKYARNHNAKKDLLFFSLSLLSPLACFYLRRHSIFNLAWKILRFSILARCQILSSLLCSARDVRKWYKASSETRARRAKEHALEIDTLSLPVKEQVQRPAHAASRIHRATFWNGPSIRIRPFFFSLFPFLLFFTIESIEVQRHIAFIDGIILTGIFNVMPVAWNLNRTRSSLMVTHVEGH